MNVSLPYSPLMNTDIDYYQTFLIAVTACVMLDVQFVWEKRSNCLRFNAECQAR